MVQAEILSLLLRQEAPEVIGTGLSALVYSWSNSGIVLKVARSLGFAPRLEREETILRSAAVWAQGTSIQIPQSFGFFRPTAATSVSKSPELRTLPFIAMEKLDHLSPAAELKLRNKYHPDQWGGRSRRLWRIYLGLDQAPGTSTFFAGDYPLLCDDVESLTGLSPRSIARDMGKFVSRLTYQGGWNAKDIEFVVAGSESKARIYCLDFADMDQHEGNLKNIVAGLYQNDPYYPQRLDRYRDDFVEGYIEEAKLAGKEALALEVLEMLHDSWYLDRFERMV